jgi:hypothetical protein
MIDELRKNLRNSFLAVINEQECPIIFAYEDGLQPNPPYMTIDLLSWDAKGQTYSPTLIKEQETSSVTTVYEVRVRTEFYAKSGMHKVAAEHAMSLDLNYDGWYLREILENNGLSLMRKGLIRRVPKTKDVETYMCYQQDCYFAFSFTQVTHTPDIRYVKVSTEHIDMWIPDIPPEV